MRKLIIVAAALILVGCGGHKAGSVATSGGSSDASTIAAKIGCSFTEEPDPELFVRQQGSCGDYTIRTFKTADLQQSWLEAAAQFAGDDMLVGDLWEIDGSGVTNLQTTLGGSIQ